jgi:magnesium transporter
MVMEADTNKEQFIDTPEIKNLIQQKNWRLLSARVALWPEAEVAEVMSELDTTDKVIFFRMLPRKIATEVFAHLESDEQQQLLEGLGKEETARLLDSLTPDDRTALLEELPANVLQRMYAMMSPVNLAVARQLLGYPEDSVGRLMTPNFLKVKPEWTIQQALDHIRKHGNDRETFNVIYVVDDEGKLLDDVRLRKIIMASPTSLVKDILEYNPVSLSAFDDQEEAVRMIKKYDTYALPVVDSGGILIGIVTVDDLLDVAEEEATEDLHKVAAVAPLDISYSKATVVHLYNKRIWWLLILAGVGLTAASVIKHYEDTLNAYMVLAIFIPLLIGSGGNTGGQSAMLMVRSLSTGETELGDVLQALSKELVVGSMLAVTMGALCFGMGLLLAKNDAMQVATVVGGSMFGIIMVANLIGCLLPFLLTRIRLDPAVASSPLIASIMDCTGLWIFFQVARSVLNF